MAKEINISIPDELADKLDGKIRETDFHSVSDYVLYLLKEVTSMEEKDVKSEQIYKEGEEEEIKKNLKDLGYI